MDAKLTLKLNKRVIEAAKRYAAGHNKSLSRMIETYLKVLIGKDLDESENESEISSFVKSMKTGVKIPTDYNYKTKRGNYLEEKHQ